MGTLPMLVTRRCPRTTLRSNSRPGLTRIKTGVTPDAANWSRSADGAACHVEAELIATEPAGGMAGETCGESELWFRQPSAFSKPRPDMPQ